MFVSPKTVLLISDEALGIYASGYKGVRLVDTVPWGAENFIQDVSRIISKECGGKPVIIMNDMVEQHYRKERVPRVSILDKSSVVRRKLNIAFPNYPLRAALPLKEKVARTDKAPPANVYIFAASPNSEQFQKTMESAKKSLVTISGFCLLPIESASMVKTLSQKLATRGKPASRWAVFLSQHRNGSLRQVVVKDGELALTRMTPISESDINVEQWASDVYQEFQATMSYMARFGFNTDDGLDVVIISNDEAGTVLENSIDTECNLHIMTVSQAAKRLGINILSIDDERYADALHAGWAARKTKLTLPMHAKAVEAISRPRQVATVASIAMVAGMGYLAYTSYNKYAELANLQDQYENVQAKKVQLNSQYDREVEKKEALGFDVRLVQSSITVHEQLESQNINALALIHGLNEALNKELRVDQVTIDRFEEETLDSVSRAFQGDFSGVMGQDNKNGEDKPFYEMVLQIAYPVTTDVDRGNEEIEQLRSRLAKALPKHTVKVQKFLKDTEYVDEFVMETDTVDPKKLAQDFIASISVRGSGI